MQSTDYLFKIIVKLQIKKALLLAALIKKTFLTQLIFGGGPINARSGLVQDHYNILKMRPNIFFFM